MTDLLQYSITEQSEQRPESTAIVLGGERWSYARLEETSNHLAHALRAAGCRRGDPVCLLLPKSPAAIVGILGILKADCAYVALDPGSPAPRLAKILQTCENHWILAAGPVRDLLDELLEQKDIRERVSVGWLDERGIEGRNFRPAFSLSELREEDDSPPDCRNTDADAAYIMFTSGSTGAPKGVVVTHANVTRFLEWAAPYFGIAHGDRLSAHSPLHFDLSVFDIFGALSTGAELHLVPADLNVLPNRLADFIRSSELTQWFSVPSVLNYMAKFDVVKQGDFPSLKRLLWCGEVFPTPALIHWMKRLPHVTFTNLYGPTEATIASSYYTIPECPGDDTAAIPIGRPCNGESLLVLDDEARAVPRGTVGHLYIQGAGLSPGYYKDPEKTRQAFVTSAGGGDRLYRTGDLARAGEDGLVYFVGRADTQIKSRGHRIELGEIATALHALRSLRESAVVAVPTDGFEGVSICCAYAALPGVRVSPATLRLELAKTLPHYMLPSRWMALDELPKNGNGKIDNRSIKERFAGGAGLGQEGLQLATT